VKALKSIPKVALKCAISEIDEKTVVDEGSTARVGIALCEEALAVPAMMRRRLDRERK
jgi:hypothetical protein